MIPHQYVDIPASQVGEQNGMALGDAIFKGIDGGCK